MLCGHPPRAQLRNPNPNLQPFELEIRTLVSPAMEKVNTSQFLADRTG